ncbi:MAG: DUF262 domain-containing protein [Nitrosopumilus sp.]
MAGLGTATNKKLLEVFNMMKEGGLILKPTFQRKLVWNDNHKENFIDTILKDLPFPEIYFADGEIYLETQKSTTLVVDGQQRLSTIYQYITNSKDFKIKRIKLFSELSDREKTNFYDYKIVVRDLGRIENDTIIDIFRRINSVQYALNAMEIRNALYEGEFISTAKEIVGKNKFLNTLDVFTETEFTRMKNIEFVLLIMVTIEEKGYFSRNSEIEDYVKKYDPIYPNKDFMISNFNTVFELIVNCSLELDSIWFRKSSFFTLVVELTKYKKHNGFVPNASSLSKILKHFENQLFINKNKDISENKFAEYYYYTFQGTTGRKGRNIRGNLLRKYLDTLK